MLGPPSGSLEHKHFSNLDDLCETRTFKTGRDVKAEFNIHARIWD